MKIKEGVVMDIQKEREAFENWHIRNMDINSDFEKISEQDSPYMDEHVNDSWLVWQAAKAQAVPECTWAQNEDGYFDASCGQSFVFSEPDDTPSSHEFTHCCFCGGQLIEAQEPAND